MMANKAMKQRHWDRMEALTGHHFDIYNENFCLRNIMEAPLLKHKEDIEVSNIKIIDVSTPFSTLLSCFKLCFNLLFSMTRILLWQFQILYGLLEELF